jgi:cytochrome P450
LGDPSCILQMIGEMLRFESLVHDFPISHQQQQDRQRFHPQRTVEFLILYGSATRDERKFPNPDVFDVAVIRRNISVVRKKYRRDVKRTKVRPI